MQFTINQTNYWFDLLVFGLKQQLSNLQVSNLQISTK